ncbi:MAG TPA: hypothetical protein VGO11_11375 [Chthoniobacteraceae bacterium]|jgi:hypothetical protein|nr:hypothetical protein [Chthoniobacteraceae bacterium]
MSKKLLFLCAVAVLAGGIWYLWPRIFFMRDSLPGREHEDGLPKVTIENGSVVYCRMRADDFRFPLPRGSRARPPVLESGSFDQVKGRIEVELNDANERVAMLYTESMRKSVPRGGYVFASPIPGGLQISFQYFGDR